MSTQYAWVNPSLWKGVDAQTAGEYIESLAGEAGYVDREMVVAAAENHRSPLHRCFEWDDARAAKMQRTKQAKNLVSNLVIKKRNKPTKVKAFVFVNPKANARRVIMTLERAMDIPAMREQVVQQAFRELQKWADRYSNYAELKDVRESLMNALERELAGAV